MVAPHSAAFRRPSRTRLLWAIGASALLLFLAYRNVVVEGRTLVATSNHHPFDDRGAGLREGGVNPPGGLNWHDPSLSWWQWEPAARFFSRAFRRGEVPLWDPSASAGADAHADLAQGQYFPPYALLLLAGNTSLQRDVYSLALVLAGGLACVLLLWKRSFHPASAATMAGAYMLGGATTFNVSSIVGQATAMVPVMVLALDWFLDRPTWRHTALLGLGLAMAILSSFHPVMVAGFLLLPLLLLSRTVLGARGVSPTAAAATLAVGARFAVAVVVALGLCAFLLFPHMLGGLGAAAEQSPPRAGAGLRHYGTAALGPLLSPRLTYPMNQDLPGKSFFMPPAGMPDVFFVGLMPCLMAVVGLTAVRRIDRRLQVFFGSAALVLLLKLFGVPPVQWLARLPFLDEVRFVPYGGAALSFSVAGLAALGVESMVRHRVSGRVVAVLLVTALGVCSVFIHFAASAPTNRDGDWRMPLFEALRLALVAAGLLALTWLRHRGALAGRPAGAMALALLAVELVPLAYRPRFQRGDVWSEVPLYVAELRTDPSLFRVHASDGLALRANIPQGLGLHALSSRHARNPPRFVALVRRYFQTADGAEPVVTSLLPSARVVLDVLNVKYLVAHQPAAAEVEALEREGFTPWKRDGEFHVFQNPRAWPRAWLARRIHVASGPIEALEAVSRLQEAGDVVVEPRPLRALATAAGPVGEARIRRHEPNLVRIAVDAPHPAVLVLSDSFAEGWTAEVNGVPAPVFPANFAFRGVEVPAGRSIVVFRYRPRGLLFGLLITVAALAATTVLTLKGAEALPAFDAAARVTGRVADTARALTRVQWAWLACAVALVGHGIGATARWLPRLAPGWYQGPLASSDQMLGFIRVPQPSQAVMAALGSVPEREAVLFVGRVRAPTFYQTWYGVGSAALPRMVANLDCGDAGEIQLPHRDPGVPYGAVVLYEPVRAIDDPRAVKVGERLIVIRGRPKDDLGSYCADVVPAPSPTPPATP